ncbi:MAG: hypothetical protein A3C43_06565 [Candidatus Schekmanbacteria bacterium RIFCSPHIGHO2_02_FULL_38_11]|uniref:Lipopolysaccharide heptosyltransferase II n=1 Tax=Candidatus Schekmanbacteria bacterium RIFCSPLOWO2_12_FULL_38_15 TaxID=1817883 RepID=A0A1F7SDH1_9BACT|nr:MAG: hypothetical protein A3C43_06565 [Candidatus Schekmanbacteria bacterium RIFCSPHIGHO2_02_FULL_38_11]OGL51479.1 MAG: hypothetical protein A3H37_12260 [Candidatus Schekmanbacteria bacterium RIFCSPLOWO2_02_FULL_38_14]OGL51829.1 MAG: hypothetical protein A3G31_12665 [Candidatus Schekmanbacteria bacterium RIFCSPLOWO2_12_FULL_38_15]
MIEELKTAIGRGEIKKILLIQVSRVGELLFVTPAIRLIRKKFPESHIILITSSYAKDVVVGNLNIDELLFFDEKSFFSKATKLKRFKNMIKVQGYDLAVIFNKDEGWKEFCRSASVKHIFDRKTSKSFLGNETGNMNHSVEGSVRFLKLLGIDEKPGRMEISYSREDKEVVEKFLETSGIRKEIPLVVFNPGCGQLMRFKARRSTLNRLWEEKKFAQLGERFIREFNAVIAINGTSRYEEKFTKRISRIMSKPPLMIIKKFSINQLAYFLTKAVVFITVDTGPMHVAASMGVPIVALYGPTDKKKTYPYCDERYYRIVAKDLSCSPCKGKGLSCKDNQCMKQITVDDVFMAAKEVMKI